MLYEQGCAQCTIWTGAKAPRAAIAANLLRQLFSKESTHPAAAKMEPHDAPPEGITCEAKAAPLGATTRMAAIAALAIGVAVVAALAIGRGRHSR